jgi:hypothetical protein
LLVEGGPTTTSAFFEAGLVNHVVWYQAAAFAGAGHVAALKGFSTPTMESFAEVVSWTCVELVKIFALTWRSDGVSDDRRGDRPIAPAAWSSWSTTRIARTKAT